MTSVRILPGFDVHGDAGKNLTYPTVLPLATGNIIVEMTAVERVALVKAIEATAAYRSDRWRTCNERQ